MAVWIRRNYSLKLITLFELIERIWCWLPKIIFGVRIIRVFELLEGLLYPIPSYQIPSLPHPTRILNTILHLYKILLPYTTLSYHIETEPNRPTAETSRIGTPSKFTRNDPNSVVCTAKMLKSFGLVYSPILRLKNVFFLARIYGKSKQSTFH